MPLWGPALAASFWPVNQVLGLDNLSAFLDYDLASKPGPPQDPTKRQFALARPTGVQLSNIPSWRRTRRKGNTRRIQAMVSASGTHHSHRKPGSCG